MVVRLKVSCCDPISNGFGADVEIPSCILDVEWLGHRVPSGLIYQLGPVIRPCWIRYCTVGIASHRAQERGTLAPPLWVAYAANALAAILAPPRGLSTGIALRVPQGL